MWIVLFSEVQCLNNFVVDLACIEMNLIRHNVLKLDYKPVNAKRILISIVIAFLEALFPVLEAPSYVSPSVFMPS